VARHVKVPLTCKQCKVTKPCDGEFFCSIGCFQINKKEERISNWLNGGPIASRRVRDYLLEKFDGRCSQCGLNVWMGKPLVVELEHKDGNSENNRPENVCLLCPNCHSQTSTYKNRNKGKGRHSRRIRYHEGKSY
jgi:hypothetical protein